MIRRIIDRLLRRRRERDVKLDKARAFVLRRHDYGRDAGWIRETCSNMSDESEGIMMATLYARNRLAWQDWDWHRCLVAAQDVTTPDGRLWLATVDEYLEKHPRVAAYVCHLAG